MADAARPVFQVVQRLGDWYWRLDIKRDNGLVGPFGTRDEAEKDARETLWNRGRGRALSGLVQSARSDGAPLISGAKPPAYPHIFAPEAN
jgi:hypothetical protein